MPTYRIPIPGLDIITPDISSIEELHLAAEGYKAWTYRSADIANVQTPTTQQVFYTLLILRKGLVLTGLDLNCSNTPSSLAANCKVGLYLAADLTLKASSADASAAWNGYVGATAGPLRTAFSSLFPVPATAAYYAAVLTVGSGTFPTFGRAGSASSRSVAASGGLRPWAFQSGQADLPGTAVLSNASSPVWFGAY